MISIASNTLRAPRALTVLLLTSPALAGGCTSSDTEVRELGSEPYTFEAGDQVYGDALARVDAKLASALSRAEASPDDRLALEQAAAYLSARARLSGDLNDYIEAEALMDAAFELAPPGAGPWLSRAQLHFTLHRLDEAKSALAQAESAILIDDPTRAAIAGQRGDIAMLEGDMDAAHAYLLEAEALDPTSRSASRLGLWHWRSGEFEVADQRFVEASARYHGTEGEIAAWFELQRGLIDLDRGELDASMEHYLEANRRLSGYYLVEEHIAEVLTLQGRVAEAHYVYTDIVERTQKPEFMDALAGLYAEHGDDAQAQSWIDDARAAYELDLALLPEAAVGHALGHFIEFGPPERAVELAEQNYALRPSPMAATELAAALLADGQQDAALERADEAMASQWKHFDIYEGCEAVYRAVGDDAAADTARALACDLAPARCAMP